MHALLGDVTASSGNVALLIGRLPLAVVFLAHGIRHIFGGGKIQGTVGGSNRGECVSNLHAWIASVTELGAAVLLVLGVPSPVAAAGLVGLDAGRVDHQSPEEWIL